nr:hypothetical protein [Tanacetum cinerariifolium]
MLNKENYVPWSSRLLRYAKSRPNGKLIHNSILNGPYVRKMIPKLAPHQDQSSFNQNYLQQSMTNPEDITDPTTTMNMALALMAKEFKLNYSTPTNNNQRISSNPRNRQIAQPAINGFDDSLPVAVCPGIANTSMNQIRNGNLVAARAEGNAGEQNGNQIICYNCRGIGHYARNCTARPRREDAAYLHTQLLIAQKEEAGIQLQAEEYDLIAAAADLDDIEEVNANCILMANLLQASTSGTQSDSTPVYDTDGSAEVHKNYDDNEIFNMFTQEEQYTELLEPIPGLHQVPHNDNDVVSEVTGVEQGGEIVEQHPEAAKFVGDFKSLANEADASLAKHKTLELEIELLQTELERTKERFENYIIKKETEYAKLWNDWYKKCDECKYDKISYDKAYKDMQQKIERLQAQLGDLKGKSKDASCVSDTQNPLSHKLENENVELEFQVLNYARENAHLKATYKNLFDSISTSRAQTQTIIASLQNELQSTIYKNAKLITQLFKKVCDQKDNTQDTSKNTKFVKQPIVENLSKIGMFRINPSKTSMKEKHVPNTVSASNKTKPIIVSQPPVITKKDMNSDLTGLSSTGVDNTKTRRPQPRSNTNHYRVPSVSKSSRSKNKEPEVEKHRRNLLFSKNNKHISSACNNIQIDSQDVISKVVCATCTKCLISVNHDKCLHNYVNGKNSRGKKQKAKVSFKENQIKYLPKVTKPKNVEHHKILATSKPRKSRLLLRWSPTGKLFDKKGKIVDSRESKSQFDCSNSDNACTSNSLEPKIKRFPNSTSLLDRENAHLKATYKNLFDSISVSCAQTKTIIASLHNELQSNIYKNAKLRTKLFKKVSDQKDNTQDKSKNTMFAKQPIVENLPKVGKTNALSKPVTSNSVSKPQESNSVNNDKVIALGIFRINPSKTSREDKQVPNTVSASVRTKPITVSQPPVIPKKDVNSDLNGLSSTGIDN